MFEQELEMEQRQSSVVPLLLIIAMIIAFVGVAAYAWCRITRFFPLRKRAI